MKKEEVLKARYYIIAVLIHGLVLLLFYGLKP